MRRWRLKWLCRAANLRKSVKHFIVRQPDFEIAFPVGDDRAECFICAVDDRTELNTNLGCASLLLHEVGWQFRYDPCRNEVGVKSKLLRAVSLHDGAKWQLHSVAHARRHRRRWRHGPRRRNGT